MGVYAGKFCWHEEWAVSKLARVIQAEIDKVEKEIVPDLSDTEDEGTSMDDTSLHFPIWDSLTRYACLASIF